LNIEFTNWFKNRWIDSKAVENGELLFRCAACNRTCRDLFLSWCYSLFSE